MKQQLSLSSSSSSRVSSPSSRGPKTLISLRINATAESSLLFLPTSKQMQSSTPDNANPTIHSTATRRHKRNGSLDFEDDETWSKLGATADLGRSEESDEEEPIDDGEIFGELTFGGVEARFGAWGCVASGSDGTFGSLLFCIENNFKLRGSDSAAHSRGRQATLSSDTLYCYCSNGTGLGAHVAGSLEAIYRREILTVVGQSDPIFPFFCSTVLLSSKA